MNYVISIILLIAFIISFIIIRKRYNNKIKELTDNFTETAKQELKNKIYNEIVQEYSSLEDYYKKEEKRLQEEYQKATNQLVEFNANLDKIKSEGIEKVHEEIKIFKEQLYENITLKTEKEYERKKEKLKKETEELQAVLDKQLQGKKDQLDEYSLWATSIMEGLSEEINDYKAKREVINKQILMERERREKESFFTINVSENDKADLKLIASFEEQFHNKEILNRAVFDTFIKKPMNEMIKRVLGGRSPSGIYMITNMLTNEIYIGRAVSVDKRWQEHCKSCFNLGTIAHSTLHTRMAKEGIWNFSFQLLEEVPKEKLSEREKYWINFYKTKEYGMNEKAGG